MRFRHQASGGEHLRPTLGEPRRRLDGNAIRDDLLLKDRGDVDMVHDFLHRDRITQPPQPLGIKRSAEVARQEIEASSSHTLRKQRAYRLFSRDH